MRKKELQLLITFHTTADAMAVEKTCLTRGLPGRLIPVPTAITAGCGLAWRCAPEEREPIQTAMEKCSITPQAVLEFML